MTIHDKFPVDFWDGHSVEGVLTGMITEMHQPIMTIKGFSQALLKADLSKEQEKDALNFILAASTYLEDLMKAGKEYTNKLHD